MNIQMVEIILFVENQQESKLFYEKFLNRKADLHVPGMTEFILTDSCKLGLMPEEGIVRILGDRISNPASGRGIPRCELYLYVDDLQAQFDHAIRCGATLVSEISYRNWGDRVCYFADPDGHIIALAEKD